MITFSLLWSVLLVYTTHHHRHSTHLVSYLIFFVVVLLIILFFIHPRFSQRLYSTICFYLFCSLSVFCSFVYFCLLVCFESVARFWLIINGWRSFFFCNCNFALKLLVAEPCISCSAYFFFFINIYEILLFCFSLLFCTFITLNYVLLYFERLHHTLEFFSSSLLQFGMTFFP